MVAAWHMWWKSSAATCLDEKGASGWTNAPLLAITVWVDTPVAESLASQIVAALSRSGGITVAEGCWLGYDTIYHVGANFRSFLNDEGSLHVRLPSHQHDKIVFGQAWSSIKISNSIGSHSTMFSTNSKSFT